MAPLQEAELAGAPDGLVTDTGRGRVVVKKGWTCRRVGLRAGTKCFTGKAFFRQGREVGQLLLSIWDPGDKGEKAGRTRSLQPSLVPVSYRVRADRPRDGLRFY